MSSSFINVGDKSVILVDCSNRTPADIDTINATLQQARDLMATAAEKSLYIITDLTNSKFNPELVATFSDFTSKNTKYVIESVLVGLSDHHRVIVSIFKKLHKRDFYITDTVDTAKKYLLSIK